MAGHVGRPRLEERADWALLVAKGQALKRRYPWLSWRTICRCHLGMSERTYRYWRRRAAGVAEGISCRSPAVR
jgi:hypothetical protein